MVLIGSSGVYLAAADSTRRSDVRSYVARSGSASSCCSGVTRMVAAVIRYRSISRAAWAGSHERMITIGRPRMRKAVVCMCSPLTWFIGMPTSRQSNGIGGA